VVAPIVTMESIPMRRLGCPRCGYDVRGAVAEWTDCCPLDGRCPECGHDFAWREVMRPELSEPPWCVEHAPRTRLVRAGCATMLRSLRPRRFWSALSMSQRMRPRRLGAYLGLLVALVVGTFVFAQAAVALQARHRIARYPSVAAVSHSYAMAVFEAVSRPLGRRSTGTITMADGQVMPYPAPNVLRVPLRWLGAGILGWVFGTGLYVLQPVGFIVLPMSRRRARVRWAHLLRVTTYSLVFPALVLVLAFLAFAAAPHLPSWARLSATGAVVGAMLAQVVLLVVWWATAIRHYLRMPNAALVAIVLLVMNALAVAVVLVLLT
jgi:hypothetical protein